MRKVLVVLCGAAIMVASAHAESFSRRLARGQALLKVGDVDEAITIFRDLQVDEPESETLHFDLGCAHYAKALDAAGDNALPEAAAELQKAVESFEDASMTSDAGMRRDAQFNRATTLAQLAKQSVGGADPEATLANFEQAVTALEDYLRQYPDHAEAQTNLNNVRYELKKYLQQSKPPEEQNSPEGDQGEGENKEQQEGKQEQENRQEQQGDQEQQEQKGEQGEQREQQDQPEQADSQEPSEGDESPEAQPQPEDGDASEDEPSESESQEIAESSENIEAILDSLQDTDERQQHEMRQQPRRMGVRSKWW